MERSKQAPVRPIGAKAGPFGVTVAPNSTFQAQNYYTASHDDANHGSERAGSEKQQLGKVRGRSEDTTKKGPDNNHVVRANIVPKTWCRRSESN